MKITATQSDGATDVWLSLTEDEAAAVAGALRSRLEEQPGYRGPGYHLHLDDGHGSELTIVVLDPD